jgi:intracellular sulfur oxidation DsrE/DsrF family protein
MRVQLILLLSLSFGSLLAQAKYQFPVIKNFGGIYAIDQATVVPDAKQKYDIVIDVFSGEDPTQLNAALNNVARMINLHAIAGVHPDSIKVVLAIHGKATKTVLNDDGYESRYNIKNPNHDLIKALKEAGVKLTVCGQSLIGRKIDPDEVNENVELATSMLTTVTTYQLKGYTLLKF